MTEIELAWLVGLLEGEGSFLKAPPSSPNCPRISLEMTDRDIVERAATLMGGNAVERINLRNVLWKPAYRVSLKGSRAVALMQILYPKMGVRRRAQIDAALATYIERKPGDNTRRLSEDQVRQIRKATNSTIAELAKTFGVSRFTIRSIREYKSWVHIH